MGTRAETTKKEKAILKFIETQVLENGYPPSVREIGKAIGLSSTATVHAYLEKLDKLSLAIPLASNSANALSSPSSV